METNVEDLKQFTTRGDGGTTKCLPDRLTWLKDEFQHIAKHAGWSVNDRRMLAEDTRYCRWPGQSTDGRKHGDANSGKTAFPFEGASDVRMRTADEISNEHVILIMAAVSRAQLRFTSPDPAKAKLGDRLAVLWEWVKNNQLRHEWFFELRRLAQYRQGDSPAVGFLQVYWKEETALQMLTFTAEEALEKILEKAQGQGVDITPEIEQRMEEVFKNPEEAEMLAAIIGAQWPDLTPKRAKDVAKQMQEDGEATFPYPVARAGRVAIQARRLMEDLFLPENTVRVQRARVYYIREWFTATELREKEAKGEFLPGFVDKMLEHEGETCWKHFTHWNVNGDWSDRIVERSWDKERHRGQYELLTAVFKASNDDGIPGIYSVRYHHAVDIPGSDMELNSNDHGLYSIIDFPREVLTGRLWDTRGVSELAMTEQQSLKTLHDSFIDHAQLSTVPPIKVPASRPKLKLVIGPLVQIKENRQDEIKWMAPPAYPQTNEEANNRIVARLDRYFGRMSKTNSPDLVRAYQGDLTESFFGDLKEAIAMALQLIQQYMDDETLQRVLGPDNLPIARSVEDIQGQFDVEMTFDTGMLSLEYVKTIAELVSNYAMKWDRAGQIRTDELEQWFFSSLSPTLARRLLQPIKDANKSEVDAAERDFGKIKDGIEPDRPTEGVDFTTRFATILNIGKANPEAFGTLTPVSRKILQEHLQYLQGQIEQQKNAVIGREMAPRTLPLDQPGAAA